MSQYDIEKFEPPPDPDLVCCICQCVLDKAVESPCRHVFCQACIERWLTNRHTCPTCRKRTRKQDLKPVLPLVQNMLNRLLMICDFRENGCVEKVMLEHFERHVTTCGYEIKVCRFVKCGRRFLKMQMDDHERDQCEHRESMCNGECGLMIALSDKPSHNCVTALKAHIDEKNRMIETLKTKLQELNNLSQSLNDQLEQLREQLNDRPRFLSSISSFSSSSDTDVTDFMSDQESLFDDNSNQSVDNIFNNNAIPNAPNADNPAPVRDNTNANVDTNAVNDVVEQVERTVVTSLFDLSSRLERVRNQMRAVLDNGFMNTDNNLNDAVQIPSAALDAIVNNTTAPSTTNRSGAANSNSTEMSTTDRNLFEAVTQTRARIVAMNNRERNAAINGNLSPSNIVTRSRGQVLDSSSRNGRIGASNNALSSAADITTIGMPIRGIMTTFNRRTEDRNSVFPSTSYAPMAPLTPIIAAINNHFGDSFEETEEEEEDEAYTSLPITLDSDGNLLTDGGNNDNNEHDQMSNDSDTSSDISDLNFDNDTADITNETEPEDVRTTSNGTNNRNSYNGWNLHYTPEHVILSQPPDSPSDTDSTCSSSSITTISSVNSGPSSQTQNNNSSWTSHTSVQDAAAAYVTPESPSHSNSSSNSPSTTATVSYAIPSTTSSSPQSQRSVMSSDWSIVSSENISRGNDEGNVTSVCSSPATSVDSQSIHSNHTNDFNNYGEQSDSDVFSNADDKENDDEVDNDEEDDESNDHQSEVNETGDFENSSLINDNNDSSDHERDWSNTTTADQSSDVDNTHEDWSDCTHGESGEEVNSAAANAGNEVKVEPNTGKNDKNIVAGYKGRYTGGIISDYEHSEVVSYYEPDSTDNHVTSETLKFEKKSTSSMAGSECNTPVVIATSSDTSEDDSESMKYLTKRLKYVKKKRESGRNVKAFGNSETAQNGRPELTNDSGVCTADNSQSSQQQSGKKQNLRLYSGKKRRLEKDSASYTQNKRCKSSTVSYHSGNSGQPASYNYSSQRLANSEGIPSRRSTRTSTVQSTTASQDNNAQSLNVKIDLSLINYNGQLVSQSSSSSVPCSGTTVLRSSANISPRHANNPIKIENDRMHGASQTNHLKQNETSSTNHKHHIHQHQTRRRELRNSTRNVNLTSSPLRASNPHNLSNRDFPNSWRDDSENETDDSWVPGSDCNETDITVTDEDYETDTSYEVQVPMSTVAMLDEYASEDTDESWTVG